MCYLRRSIQGPWMAGELAGGDAGKLCLLSNVSTHRADLVVRDAGSCRKLWCH